jgi:hypothetical protein
MNRIFIQSSNLESVGWEAGTLEIKFKRGGIYQYSNVPEHIFQSLLIAPSKGRYFAQFIKDRYFTIRLV